MAPLDWSQNHVVQRALEQLRETGEDTHQYTAQARYRVAQHYLRIEEYQASSQLLDQALEAYPDNHSYGADIARINFLQAQLLNASGKPAQAQQMLQQSVKDFNGRYQDMLRTADNLTEADFDKIARYGF
ncbi:hypothetical protein MMC30_003073 [Trapelia coarctata]|nr:hypothetical protein [Trapelia coarctata]